jgi:hypothetical protein
MREPTRILPAAAHRAHGTADEVAKAKSIIEATGAAQTAIHSGVTAT